MPMCVLLADVIAFKYFAVTCPSNSHCHMQAPGTQWCVCDNSYYGYKCLRQVRQKLIASKVDLVID